MKACVTLTFVLAVSLYPSAAEDAEDPLQVLYKSQTYSRSPGSSVRLLCQTDFDPERCSDVHAVWFHKELPLSDPDKYLTAVNESVGQRQWRRRHVLTEILRLGPEDDGHYQCRATANCTMMKTWMGHLIHVTVT
ncbi:unnamed protein product [Knipowitschia caucasica]|uniref:Ig-like domain-containing protein n=1 Tax=Knipowitschia caucasica TaxID=637954 RepID=A0AAV2MFU4_KNICA